MKNLFDMGLTFVGKTRGNNDTIITSDLLTVKSHRFYLLLHLVLSVWKNPSVIILNSSIVGHPNESLREIIGSFHKVSEIDEAMGPKPDFACRQVIVVGRSPDCRELFQHEFKLIQCTKEGGKASVQSKVVRNQR